MTKNYRPFTLWIPLDDGLDKKKRTSVGVPIEKNQFGDLWKCFSAHMLRQIGDDRPFTDLHANLDELGNEFEAVPWTDEYEHLRHQLNDQFLQAGVLVSDEVEFTGYEDKVIACTGYVYDPELGQKMRMGIGMDPSMPFWMLLKAFSGQMLCKLGSSTPITDLYTPLSQLDVTTFDAIPWTDEYAALRAQLDAIEH